MALRSRVTGRGLVLLLALGLLLGAAFAASAKPLDPGKSADNRLVEYRVDIPAGDHVIPAILAVPKAGGPNAEHPAVLMLHGFASYKDEVGEMYKREARYLAVAGYASLRIDFAGSGESAQPFVENDFDGMVADARTALDWLIDHSSTDDGRVGVLGFSLGSRVAATVAGTDDRVAAFASWSGDVNNGRDGWEGFFAAYYADAQADGSVVVDLGWTQIELGLAWFDTMDASRAQDAVGGFFGPLLAVAGEDDGDTPMVARELILNAGSFDATLQIIPGADHIYHVLTPDQTFAEHVMLLTAEWFADKL
jgi:dienelactone hydrolase